MLKKVIGSIVLGGCVSPFVYCKYAYRNVPDEGTKKPQSNRSQNVKNVIIVGSGIFGAVCSGRSLFLSHTHLFYMYTSSKMTYDIS
jgi:hypothetical protein